MGSSSESGLEYSCNKFFVSKAVVSKPEARPKPKMTPKPYPQPKKLPQEHLPEALMRSSPVIWVGPAFPSPVPSS